MNDANADTEILEGIRAGDKAACTLCIDTYAPVIYRLALSLMENEADAEDVVQETFLNAFKAIDKFEGRSGLGTWLYRIAYNNAMMRLRKTTPETDSIDEALTSGDEGFPIPQQFFDWCCLPEQDFQTAEVREQLTNAMAELPPLLKSVFVMRQLEGMSTRETAQALEVSEDVVKTRLHRARLHLRESLSTYFADMQMSM